MKQFVLFILLSLVINVYGQNDYPYPSLSPLGKISQQLGNTKIEVEYERPLVRQRKIFGELVPWNKVWRTGAGNCTKIRFDKPVVIGAQKLPAGTYSLFTIPGQESWIVILNKDTTLYGSSFYNHERDAVRFVVKPTQADRHYEALTIDIDLFANNGKMNISWANTAISFDILTRTDEEIMRYIQEQIASDKSQNPDLYAGAAEYLLYQGKELNQALAYADKALQLDKNSWAGNIKMKLLEVMGHYNEAAKYIEQNIEAAKKGKYDREKDRQDRIKQLENDLARVKSKQGN